MTSPTVPTRTTLESRARLLRERERNLQHLAQSARCSDREGAEQELGRVRAELAGIFVDLRHAQAGEAPACTRTAIKAGLTA